MVIIMMMMVIKVIILKCKRMCWRFKENMSRNDKVDNGLYDQRSSKDESLVGR